MMNQTNQIIEIIQSDTSNQFTILCSYIVTLILLLIYSKQRAIFSLILGISLVPFIFASLSLKLVSALDIQKSCLLYQGIKSINTIKDQKYPQLIFFILMMVSIFYITLFFYSVYARIYLQEDDQVWDYLFKGGEDQSEQSQGPTTVRRSQIIGDYKRSASRLTVSSMKYSQPLQGSNKNPENQYDYKGKRISSINMTNQRAKNNTVSIGITREQNYNLNDNSIQYCKKIPIRKYSTIGKHYTNSKLKDLRSNSEYRNFVLYKDTRDNEFDSEIFESDGQGPHDSYCFEDYYDDDAGRNVFYPEAQEETDSGEDNSNGDEDEDDVVQNGNSKKITQLRERKTQKGNDRAKSQ